MVRLGVALLLAVFLGQALTSPSFAVVAVCVAACPDDGPDGDCAPVCVECGCCANAPRTLVASPVVSVLPAARSHRVAAAPAAHLPARDPQDVFHVPRLHAA